MYLASNVLNIIKRNTSQKQCYTFQLSTLPVWMFHVISQKLGRLTLTIFPRVSLTTLASLVLITWKPVPFENQKASIAVKIFEQKWYYPIKFQGRVFTWGKIFLVVGNWTCVDETTWPASTQRVECRSVVVIVKNISSAKDEAKRGYQGPDSHSNS